MKNIIGDWKLIDYSRFTTDGREIKWEGKQVGNLHYDANGSLSMKIERTSPNKNLNKLDLARLNIWYRGKFEIIDDGKIIHKIEETSDQKRVGKQLVRRAVIQGDQLTIEGIGLKERVKLVWVKVQK